MKTVVGFTLMLLLVLSSVPVLGQTTGRIDGTVTDPTGAVVANARVSVSSPSLQGAQEVDTDSEGRFRIFNLPPGRYTVTASAQGFQARELRDVQVNLDRTTTLDVALAATGVTEEVTVTSGDSAAVDVTSSEVNTTVTEELFDRLPTTRTLQSVINIAPSVVGGGLRDQSGRESSPSVAGSSGPENNYILDGVSTTDPATGLQGAQIAFDFIEEVQVKTNAFAAEYGQATGGIVNAITKSGGDEFHGDVFFYFNPAGFVAETRESAIPTTGAIPDGYSEYDFGADLGGPIVREKLWFFAAVNPQFRTNQFLGQAFRQPFEQEIDTPFYAGKLTWQPHQNHRLTASTFSDITTLEGGNIIDTGAAATGFSSDLGYLQVKRRTGGPNYAFKYDGNLTDRLIVNATLGLHYQRLNVDPLDPARALLPFTFDVQAVDPITGQFARNLVLPNSGPGNLTSQRRNRWEAGFDVTYLLPTEHFGEHTLKSGYEYQDNFYDVYTYRSGGGWIQNRYTNANPGDINNPELEFAFSRFDQYQLDATTHTLIHSYYIQDNWKVGRNLTLNLGVRWEHPIVKPDDAIASTVFQEEAEFGGRDYYFKFTKFWENAAPRLGFSWDYTGEGKGKLFGSFSRFYQSAIPLDLNARAASGEVFILDFYTGPNATGELFQSVPLAAHPTAVDPGLKAAFIDEAVGGIAYELFEGFGLEARFVWRNLGRAIEDGSFDQGGTYFIMNPGESSPGGTTPFTGEAVFFTGLGLDTLVTIPEAVITFPTAIRRYRAVEIQASKRFSNNYTFTTSYTWSKLNGNYEGLYRNDNGQLDPNITSLFDLPELLYNTFGRLPNDRPHQFKFDGAYEFDWGLNVGLSFRAQSGTPVSFLGPHPIYGNGEAFLLPRGTCPDDPSETCRTPVITNTDLHVAYTHNFSERYRGQIILDLFNVFNQQKAIQVDQLYRLIASTGTATLPQSPVNPLFGTGNVFQYPFAARIGLKFQF